MSRNFLKIVSSITLFEDYNRATNCSDLHLLFNSFISESCSRDYDGNGMLLNIYSDTVQ